ncbi:MAG TPA: Uma2 family endonuclease [Nannocystis sp.]|jgi:Uma2 family endonuclease
MPAPAVRRATYQDVLDAPPNTIAEVIFGTLHTQPRPAFAHGDVTSNLGAIVVTRFGFGDGGPGGLIIRDEPELHLGAEPDILVPDLAGWHRERLRALPENAPWTNIAPDWVCEVLSPSTQALERNEKMAIYLRERVTHVWLIDPLARILEVYRHDGPHWARIATHQAGETVRAEPFDATEIQLRRLWER